MNRIALAVVLAFGICLESLAELPPVPVPAENPISEAKRVLGKILFWDEQLSSNDTVACGTCHRPRAGGTDPRKGVYPGKDPGTIDNVFGSPGIVSLDSDGRPVENPIFGFDRQITPRASPSNFAALWAPEVFWDGRARGRLVDPLTGHVAIESGGALENQALESLANPAEMAKTGRTWQELTDKLAERAPLALASSLPPDVSAALSKRPSYAALFADAFGDERITPVRIVFAIAAYERTLVADQTPWDRYQAGDETALTQSEIDGWREFQEFHCANCHEPPLFTSNDFMNIGLRIVEFDIGRMAVTKDPEDAGEVKIPSLRNVGLHPRFMHTGQIANLGAAIAFYVNGAALEHRDDIPGIGTYSFNMSSISERNLRSFLEGALTDPRVANEQFPFDRPMLKSETAEAAEAALH